MALTAYQVQTQALLHDPNAQAYSITDINRYINLARNQVAIEGECVRARLSGGTITQLSILSGGTGYSGTATVTIAGGGAQAFATATIAAGAINTVTLVDGGWGYIPASSITVTATGSGGGNNATFNVTVDNSATTVTGQEVLSFTTLNNLLAAWNTAAAANQGAQIETIVGGSQVIKVFSIACNQAGTYKPMLQEKIWSEFQAYLRIYSNTQQNYPLYWSRYGRGVNGSIYLFPWPAQPLQLDLDVCCTVIPLVTDSTAEAITYPWTDAIPFYAAYMAYNNSSRPEDAQRMFAQYELFMKRAGALVDNPFMPDYYGYEY